MQTQIHCEYTCNHCSLATLNNAGNAAFSRPRPPDTDTHAHKHNTRAHTRTATPAPAAVQPNLSHAKMKLLDKPAMLLFLAALLATAPALLRAEQQQPPQNTRPDTEKNAASIIVVQVTGEVYVFAKDETYRIALRAGSLVNAGQMIATGPKASITLAFSNGATVTIGEKSIVSVDEFVQTPFGEMFKMAEATKEPSSSRTRLDMVRGEITANIKKLNKAEGSTFEIKTPLGMAGIRGTTFKISFVPGRQTDTRGAGSAPPRADFSLIMLEGEIEMSIPNRPRPIHVTQGRQLVLLDIDVSKTLSGVPGQDDDAMTPEDAPAAAQAQVLQHAQAMLAAVSNMSIPASHPGPDPASHPPGQDAGKDNPKTQDTQENNPLSPSPPPQNPAPRLSPSDGMNPL